VGSHSPQSGRNNFILVQIRFQFCEQNLRHCRLLCGRALPFRELVAIKHNPQRQAKNKFFTASQRWVAEITP
jgi:hypothetical protein